MDKINNDLKLSEKEIKKLFEFTEKKFVHWYDLQIEIVDHLASSIETEMQAATNLTFEIALDKVYKSFGLFGFARIVQERQKQLAKAAKKKWWNELQALFQWPRILLILLIVSTVWTLSLLVSDNILSELFLFIYITICTLFFIYIIKDHRLQKKLLLMQCGSSYFSLPFIFEFFVISIYTQMSSLSFTILLTLGILIKITSFKLYSKIRSDAKLFYPTAFLK